jgi:hypothetical protein
MTATTFASRCHYDANLFSEPMAIMNLLWEYNNITSSYEQKWSKMHGIFLPRLKRIQGTCNNLQRRVAEFLKVPNEVIQISAPPCSMPHALITILRIIQVWVFNETLIQFDPSTVVSKENSNLDHFIVPLLPKSARIEEKHMQQILKNNSRHPFSLIGQSSFETKGSIPLNVIEHREDLHLDQLDIIQERLISYASEKEFSLVVVDFEDSCTVYFRENKYKEVLKSLPVLAKYSNEILSFSARMKNEGKARGRDERACGLWKLSYGSKKSTRKEKDKMVQEWCQISFMESYKKLFKGCDVYFETSLLTRLCLNFTVCRKVDTTKGKVLKFALTVHGTPNRMSDLDLRDLFAYPNISAVHKNIHLPQKLMFPFIEHVDFGAPSTAISNVKQSPVHCIPEAARLLSSLASSRRGHENMVCLLPITESNNDSQHDTNNTSSTDQTTVDIYLDPKKTNVVLRWKRFGSQQSQVYIDSSSVPGNVVPIHGTEMLYCTCSNTLEVRGGGLRAEGLTLLPPGKLFLQLCRFTFGLYNQENVDDGTYIEKTIAMADPDCPKATKKILKKRIKKAVEFNESSKALGEKLLCFPDKVALLVEIFNGVDGYECTVWDELRTNPFCSNNLELFRQAKDQKQAMVDLEQRTINLMINDKYNS